MARRVRNGRRRFLSALGTAGAGTLIARLPSSAQTPGAPPRRIDIHQHFVSPAFYATLNAKNAASPVPGLAAWKGFSPSRAVEDLDRVGIATAMLSITAPGVWFGNADEARRLAREMNEYAASRTRRTRPAVRGCFRGCRIRCSSTRWTRRARSPA